MNLKVSFSPHLVSCCFTRWHNVVPNSVIAFHPHASTKYNSVPEEPYHLTIEQFLSLIIGLWKPIQDKALVLAWLRLQLVPDNLNKILVVQPP